MLWKAGPVIQTRNYKGLNQDSSRTDGDIKEVQK